MSEGPYVIEHGEVWFVHQGASTPGGKAMRLDRRHVCGPSDNLAVAFDEEDGILHKHGTETAVRAWADGEGRVVGPGDGSDDGQAQAQAVLVG